MTIVSNEVLILAMYSDAALLFIQPTWTQAPLCTRLCSRCWETWFLSSQWRGHITNHPLNESVLPLYSPSLVQCPAHSRSSIMSSCLGQQYRVMVKSLEFGIQKTWVWIIAYPVMCMWLWAVHVISRRLNFLMGSMGLTQQGPVGVLRS